MLSGSGCIEFEEFLEMMVLQMQDTSEEAEVERMFEVFDKDEDKFVSVGELK